jgi:hypothetical protein
MAQDVADVLHYCRNILENEMIHPLQDVGLPAGTLIQDHPVGVVDVTRPVWNQGVHLTCALEFADYFPQLHAGTIQRGFLNQSSSILNR